jgi:hypothetical protein
MQALSVLYWKLCQKSRSPLRWVVMLRIASAEENLDVVDRELNK